MFLFSHFYSFSVCFSFFSSFLVFFKSKYSFFFRIFSSFSHLFSFFFRILLLFDQNIGFCFQFLFTFTIFLHFFLLFSRRLFFSSFFLLISLHFCLPQPRRFQLRYFLTFKTLPLTVHPFQIHIQRIQIEKKMRKKFKLCFTFIEIVAD